MKEEVSFKTRVKDIAIMQAKLYKNIFIDYEYLVCSRAFIKRKFYIINAKEENYMHLIGVNSELSAKDFFDKCYEGTLEEDDFNFIKHRQSEKAVKGSVRRKIKVLPDIMNMFSKQTNLLAEEDFKKNNIFCNLATSDGKCTMGFINTSKSYPKTLIAGNNLKTDKSETVELLLSKKTSEERFSSIIIGDRVSVLSNLDFLKDIVDDTLIEENVGQKEVAVEGDIK